MLDAMRRNTKVILWITIIFFVLLIFLVWGADLQFGGGPQPNVLGRVNGEAISVAEYQQELARGREMARYQGRELQPSDDLLLQEQAWDTIVQRKLLEQEAAKRNFRARDSEVSTVLLNDPPPFITQDPSFHNEQGQFDLASYRALIRDPNVPEGVLIQLENQVRAYLPLQKLENFIVAAAKVTEDEVRRAYLEQNEKATVSFVLFDALRTEATADPTDAEIEAYFAENMETYRLPRRATLRYVTIPRRPAPEDSVTLIRELEDMAGEARRAETARAAGTENLAYSDFETLAMSFSDAPSADEGGLSAGYLTPAEMSPAFRQALGDLGPGRITEPFQDGPSYHILQVVDVKEEDGERRIQFRDLAMKIAPSDSTLMAQRDMLDEVRRQALASGLETAAASAGLEVLEAADVTPAGIVPGLSAVPQIATFAHENAPGTVSRVLATNNAWFLVEVAGHEESELPALEDVRNRVEADLIREVRFETVRATADRFVGRIKMGESLEDAATADSLRVTTSPEATRQAGFPGVGRDPEPTAAAFALPVGEVSSPLRTTRGWVVLRVDERPEVDWTAYEVGKDGLRRSLLNRKQTQILSTWLEDLRRKADIEDFRI